MNHKSLSVTSCIHSQTTWLRQQLLPLSTLVLTVPPTSKLQRVQTSVACAVLPNLSQQLATALLSELHLLPVNSRITFKLACLTYKLLTTSQPANKHMLLHQYTPTCTLRSTDQFFLDVPQFSTEFCKRSFSYLATTVWNGLPLNIRPTFDTFKHRLKTHLFK